MIFWQALVSTAELFLVEQGTVNAGFVGAGFRLMRDNARKHVAICQRQ